MKTIDEHCGCIFGGQPSKRSQCPIHWTTGMSDMEVAKAILQRLVKRWEEEDRKAELCNSDQVLVHVHSNGLHRK